MIIVQCHIEYNYINNNVFSGNSIPVLEKTQLTYEKDLDFLKDVVNFTPSEEEEEKVETNTLHPKECQAPK